MSVAVNAALVDQATFIFKGTVLSVGPSSVRILDGRPGLAVAAFDRGFRVNPMLGDLAGHKITVGIAPGSEPKKGEQLIFFANSWVHAEAIAVSAIAQLPANERVEAEISAAIDDLPALYLARRVAGAAAIVQGTVGRITEGRLDQPISEHMATWKRAEIALGSVFKGSAGQGEPTTPAEVRAGGELEVFFPADTDDRWQSWPKLAPKQRVVLLLHRPSGVPLPEGAWVVPDPDDVQPAGAAARIRKLVADAPKEAQQ